MRRAGGDWLKMELSASLTQKVANMLPADFRNMPDQWVKHVDGKMQSTLETCGGKGKVIISDLANLLISLGSGNFSGYVKQHVPQAPVKYHLEKTNNQGFWASVGAELDALNRAAANAKKEAAAGMTVAAARGIDMALKGSAAARMMLSLGRTLLAWAGQLTAKLLSMYSSHLKPLLNKLLEAFSNTCPKGRRGGQQSHQQGQERHPAALSEVTSRFKGKIKPPPKCACAASPNSIGYVLGEESLQHTDFSLPGVLPIIWTRQYRSNFDGNDARGDLGARWGVAYGARFDIEGEALKHHDDSCRTLDYPLLPVGESLKDELEGFTLSRLSDT